MSTTVHCTLLNLFMRCLTELFRVSTAIDYTLYKAKDEFYGTCPDHSKMCNQRIFQSLMVISMLKLAVRGR